jgi:hypothetical protein
LDTNDFAVLFESCCDGLRLAASRDLAGTGDDSKLVEEIREAAVAVRL